MIETRDTPSELSVFLVWEARVLLPMAMTWLLVNLRPNCRL